MKKQKTVKIIILSLFVAVFSAANGGFYSSVNAVQAGTKTKWQKMLEENGVDKTLWEKYLPNISRSEYNKVTGKSFSPAEDEKEKKKVSDAAKVSKKAKASKWQKILERNGVDRALWQKYLPKVSKGEYNKVKKALKKATTVSSGSLGPDMKVGLFQLNTANRKTITVKNTAGLSIKDKSGTVLREVSGGTNAALKADLSDKNFSIRGGDGNFTTITNGDYLLLEPFDSGGIFDVDDCEVNTSADKKSDNPYGCYKVGEVKYDKFRGKLELSFNDAGTPWVINVLPMEQYTWGTGEIGDSKTEYYKLFSTIFRTYGYYHNEKRTKHADEDFTLNDTSNDQIYKGYRIEERFPKMKAATEETRGRLVRYKGKTALTPYCSYTNGKTRKYPGDDFPYLKAVKDHKNGIKKSLKPGDDGNHMYGLSAHGAVGYVADGKSCDWILKHYYTGVKVEGVY